MNRKLIFPLALLVLLVAVAVPRMAAKNAEVQDHRSAPVVVLPTYGSFSYFATRPLGNTLGLQLLSGADALDPDQLQLRFPGDALTAQVEDCIPVYTHDGYTLWTLYLRLTLQPGMEHCTVSQIDLNGRTYELGSLEVQYLPQSGPTGEAGEAAFLSLRSHLGVGVGRGLQQNYHAAFRNDTLSPLAITEVSDPSFDGAPLDFQVNGQPVSPDLPLRLEPGGNLDVTMALTRWDGAARGRYETYYVSPILRYDHLGQEYTIPMLPCALGFSMSQEEFIALCGEYMDKGAGAAA